LVSGRRLITPHSCSKKLPGVFSTPSSFGTWPMMIVKARPTMKPLSTGSEIKDATNHNPQQCREHPRDAGADCECCAKHYIACAVAVSKRHDDRRRQCGRCRHRADDQVPGAAKQCVKDQRWGGSVETYHGGTPAMLA
jgi:hypothetical protein